MRDYLFRGKRKDNGEWVYWNIYGEFCTSKGRRTRLTRNTYCSEKYFYHIDEIKQLIDPETVGQYTGLTDKNGKKIFEGDIVSRYVNQLDKRVNASVKNNTTVASWTCEFFLYKDKKEVFLANRVGKNDCYIVGNIYDNPELLKGSEN